MRFQLLSFVVLCSGTSLFGAVEKPFNFYETPGKLPKQVVPTEYSVRVVPNIENFTFAGSEMVKLNVRSPIRQLVLNALELKVQAASVDGKQVPASAIRIDKETELLTLTLPSELAAGDHSLTLRFTGKINQQGQGLFYVRYQEQGSGARKVMLGTQFEAKWLRQRSIDGTSLEVQDFSATTDLYSVTANVYAMREVPFSVRDLIGPIVISAMLPFLPLALVAIPLKVIIQGLAKLLF